MKKDYIEGKEEKQRNMKLTFNPFPVDPYRLNVNIDSQKGKEDTGIWIFRG